MNNRARSLLCVAAAALLSCSGTSGSSSKLARRPAVPCQPYQLVFAPPDELTFEHQVDVERTLTVRTEPVVGKLSKLALGPPPSSTQRQSETVRRTELVVIRRSPDGYVMTTSPEPAVVLHDSKPAGAMAHVPFETALTYRLDANGRVLTIEGFQGIEERMLQAARTDAEREAAARATAYGFERERRLEWAELLGDGAQPKGCIGEAHVTEAKLQLSHGPTRYYRAVRPSGFVDCALGSQCLALEQRYDDSRMMLDGWLEGVWMKRGRSMSKPFVAGSAKIVLDPATMRLASGEAKRELNVVESDSRRRVTTTSYEKLRHRFEYR
jgi:hypothetical protein